MAQHCSNDSLPRLTSGAHLSVAHNLESSYEDSWAAAYSRRDRAASSNDSERLAQFRVREVMIASDVARLPRGSYRYPMVVLATVSLLFAIMHG